MWGGVFRKAVIGGVKVFVILSLWVILLGTNIPVKIIGKDVNLKTITNLPQVKVWTLFGGDPLNIIKNGVETDEMRQKIEDNADAVLDAIGGLQAVQRFKKDPHTGRAEVIITLREFPFAKFLLSQGPPGKGLSRVQRERLGKAFKDKYVEKLRREHQRLIEEIYRLEVQYARATGKSPDSIWRTKILREYFIGLNGIYTEVTPEIIPQIKKLGYVEDVYENKRIEPLLIDSVPLIQADYAHAIGYKGSGIAVGILDTGLNRFHPDLVNSIWHNSCEIPGDGKDNDGNCPGDTNGDGTICGPGDAGVDDDWGWDFVADDKEPVDEGFHGTHVAGIVAGNGSEIKGVAPEAKLLSYRVCGATGGCYYDDIIAALEMAQVQFGIDCGRDNLKVLNLSLGGPGIPCDNDPNDFSCDPLVKEVNSASDVGLLVVVAGGNNGNGNYFTLNSSPAVAEKALTVGATDKMDNLAEFTPFGPSAHKAHIKPEIVAPGVKICSDWSSDTPPPPEFFETCIDERHILLSGTSMATPHVAGASAVVLGAIKERYGEVLPAEEIKSLLTETGNILNPGGVEASIFKQGGGRLNVKKAIDAGAVITPGVLNLGQASFAGRNFWATSSTLYVHNYSDQDIILQLTYSAPDGVAVNIPSSLVVAKKNYGVINAGFTLYSWAPPPGESYLYEGRITASYSINGEVQTLHVPFSIIPAPIMVTFAGNVCPLGVHIHNRKDLRIDFFPVPVCVDNPDIYCLYDWRLGPGLYDFIFIGVDKLNPGGSCDSENLDMNGNVYYLVKENHSVNYYPLNLFNFGEARNRINLSLKDHNGENIFTPVVEERGAVSMNLAFYFERDNPPQPGPTYPDSATPYGSLYLGPYPATEERLHRLYFSSVSRDYNIDFMFKASKWKLQPDGKVKTTNELIKASFDGLGSDIIYENCTTPDDCAGRFHVTTKFGYRHTDEEGCYIVQGGDLVETYRCHANLYMPFTGRHELSPWAPFVWFLPQYFMNWMGLEEDPIIARKANPSIYNNYTITLYQMESAHNFAFRDIEFEVWGVDMYLFCMGKCCMVIPMLFIYPYTISPYFATESIAEMKGYLPDLAEVHRVENGKPYIMNQGSDIPFVKFNNEPKKINLIAPLGKYNFHFVNQNGEFDEPAMDTEVYLDGQLVFSEYNVLASSYWYNPPRTIDLPYSANIEYLMGLSKKWGSVALDDIKLTAKFSNAPSVSDKNPPYIEAFDVLSEEGYPAESLRAGQSRIIRFKVKDDETGLSVVQLYYRPACPWSPAWSEKPWAFIPLRYEGNDTYSAGVPFNMDPTWAECSGVIMPDGTQWMWTQAEFKIVAKDNELPENNSITLELTGESGFRYSVPYNIETFPVNIMREGIGGFLGSYTFDPNTKVWSTSSTNGLHVCNCSSSELRDVIGVYLRDFPVYLPDYDTWVNFLLYMFNWGWNVYNANTITYPTQYYASPQWQDVGVYNVQLLSQPDGSIMLGDPQKWKTLPTPEELGSLEVCLGPERRQFAEQMLLNPAPYFWYGHFDAAPAPGECVCKPRLMEWYAPNLENFVSQVAFVAFLPEYDPLANGRRIVPLISEIDEHGRIILRQEFEVR